MVKSNKKREIAAILNRCSTEVLGKTTIKNYLCRQNIIVILYFLAK